ncbi:MAG: hypothetical protein J5J06_15825 [Phycisphaerae bacterium]|nr:hypothetical protein [Phycisphaerae bacterium]
MSHFDNRFQNHALQNSLKELQQKIDSAKLKLDDTAQTEGYARFCKIVSLAKGVLETVDPELVTEQALNQVQGAISNMSAHFDAFVEKKDWNHLNQPADQLLNVLHLLPRNELADGDRPYAEQIAKLQGAAESVVDGLRAGAVKIEKQHQQVAQKVSQLGQKVGAFESEIVEQKKRIDTLINEQTTQFSQRAEERNTKFNEQHGRFEQTESQRAQQFAERFGQFKTEHKEVTNEIRESAKKLLDEQRTAFDTLVSEHRSESQEVLDELKVNLEEAAKIVGLIGNTGLTGNYQRVANAEKKIADLFRWIAIGCMLVMVVCVVLIVRNITAQDFNWEIALFRLLAAIAFGAPAWYCAHESTRHRRNEHRNRRIELELASLSPYLAEMPDEERRKIIAELSKDYFGREDDLGQDEIVNKLKHLRGEDLIKLMERLLKAARP